MKRIVSVSLGSSKRDHYAEVEIIGEKFVVERIGTDGSIKKAVDIIRFLDGKVDAFGMGGIDLYLWAGEKRFIIREALPLKNAAIKTPILDGSGLKNTLERKVIQYLDENDIVRFHDKKVLIPCALDRFGMAESIEYYGGKLILGDIIFALGLNIPIYSLKKLYTIAKLIAPVVCKLPFHMLYPTGNKQDKTINSKLADFYEKAEIIAGDYHYIKRYMPDSLKGKIIITNTLTESDIKELKERGVTLLITSTPKIGNRSFGTNVLEAMIVSILNSQDQIKKFNSVDHVLKEMNLKPRIEKLKVFSHS
jgi:hypothetical protein